MNKVCYIVLLLVVLGAGTAWAQAGYTVEGLVSDGSQGVAGVTLRLAGAASDSAGTDGSGLFRFTGLQDGDYSVTPEAVGYVFSPAQLTFTIAGGGANLPIFEAVRTTAVAGTDLPAGVQLSALYPNPFSGTADVTLALPVAQAVQAVVYDLAGRAVATVFAGVLSSGVTHTLRLNRSGLASGVYLLRIQGAQFATTQPFVVLP